MKQKYNFALLKLFICSSICFFVVLLFPVCFAAEQIPLPRIDAMPSEPSPYHLRDWKKVARDYVEFVLDENKRGDLLPLVKWNDNSSSQGMFILPSYVGRKDRDTEAINGMALVVTGSLMGLDMTNYKGINFVRLVSDYYYCEPEGMFGNDKGGCGVTEYWYKILPNFLFYHICDQYPHEEGMKAEMLRIADQLYRSSLVLGGTKEPWNVPEYEHWSFDFATMQARNDRHWKEAGAAAAYGWLGYMAFAIGGNQNHLDVADWAMGYLSKRDSAKNPLYEIMLRYAPITVARMNAELGRNYDLDKMLRWCTGISDNRYGWGVISGERWGEYNCDGLVGSTTDTGGYAFTMNTFQAAGMSVPIVRYDQRYAHTIGKWMLNLVSASRLFYANGLGAELQDNKVWCDENDPNYCLAYEGLRKHSRDNIGKRPYATGDAMGHSFPSNLGLYGSSHVGYLAAVVNRTNMEKILQLDCLATDFFHEKAYPTYLYYNPFPEYKKVKIEVGTQLVDLYDLVSQTFLKRNVSGTVVFNIMSDSAMVLVLAPAGGKVSYQKGKMIIDGIVVDYRHNGKNKKVKK
ncbi:unnamed protein product [marine sediment metagenome]|uniref:Linalool dehydratase/isomerase domain-containing protein n=1 Tax=marine sediment metagenome TaxID=412755 RepID=X1B0H6_9ZZZZ